MRNERETRRELIDPALRQVGWSWEAEHLIGPGRVNVGEGAMYDPAQELRADYLLRAGGLSLAVLEAKSEEHEALDGLQQAERYARRLSLRFALASNGHGYVLVDTTTGDFEERTAPPSPLELLERMGREPLPEAWRKVLEAALEHEDYPRGVVRTAEERSVRGTGHRAVMPVLAHGCAHLLERGENHGSRVFFKLTVKRLYTPVGLLRPRHTLSCCRLHQGLVVFEDPV